ncbi:MAG: LapA family protein [Vallitaleaceae bacterium]|nr:LapA family protein [Vallitaleaceae bacterium]
MPVAFIFSLLFSVLVVVFALQNSAIVTLNFFSLEIMISQTIVILISASFGAIIILFLSTVKQIKSNMRIRSLTKTIDKSEEKNRLIKENENNAHMKQLEEENKQLKDNEAVLVEDLTNKL